MSSRLAELARLKGIAAGYDDIWGRSHPTPPEAQRRLLSAMGCAADDDAAVEAAIAAHEAAAWRRVLPPASVAGADGATLTLRLPDAQAGTPLVWRLVLEDGEQREGSLRPSECETVERGWVDGQPQVAHAWRLPGPLPEGYHRLGLLHGDALLGEGLLIVAPERCHLPEALQGERRAWGCTAQLYAVRSERNWGIGDFADLAAIVETGGRRGAAVVGLNPLHALFPGNPAHASPYSPSSRLYLNTLYIDVEAVEDFAECEAARSLVGSEAFQAGLARLRATDIVDYEAVAAAKTEVLELLHAHFVEHHVSRDTPRAQAFQRFCAERGESLRRHALFEALQERFQAEDAAVWGWPVWPPEYRSPDSPAVQRFAREQALRVDFRRYLQWLADGQLEAVRRSSQAMGTGIGLYTDLAVSIDRAGAEAWAGQDLYALGASVGAPPDDFNLLGQDWGLPPMLPQRLADAGYAPFVEMLRANMRHAGALRIDHVMALMRLYWVPQGSDAAHGAYVHYPFEELLAIVRLESVRQRCLVIGEDLGTVPQQVRERLAASGVLSYRLLFFERDADGAFLPPSQHEPQALLAASTHDLPTLAGWWEGRDLALRERLGLFPDEAMRRQQALQRAGDRARLLLALETEGLLPPGTTPDPSSAPSMTPELALALQQWLARSRCKLLVVQLEDVLGVRDQVNLPGTTDAHPNWRLRLPLALERWPQDPRWQALVAMLAHERAPRQDEAPRARTVEAVIPRATYRVQLHRGFRFADAAALVPYLAGLGISHLYTSPFLRARAGSLHGYDIVDHNALNPEIGDRADLDRLVAELRRHGMGLLIDVVPNHMGVLGGDNAWWMDVLEDGPASAFAEFFDIDWSSADPALTGRVLLPILGEQYGVVLERGELKLQFEPAQGRVTLAYYEHRLPIDPARYGGLVLSALAAVPDATLPPGAREELAQLAEAFAQLPPQHGADAAGRARRRRDKTVLKAQLAHLAGALPAFAEAMHGVVAALSGIQARQRRGLDALDELVGAQAYRLAQWRVAADEINYRRFFDINELAALRMERPEVFEATHRLVMALAAEGSVDGLRIDHPDGLADPAGYFRRLQDRHAKALGAASPGAVPGAALPLYVVTEKIVAPHEELPREWTVHGTTGYRYANVLNGLMIDAAARPRLDRAWRAFVGDEAEDFDELARRCKHVVMESSMAGELTVLATALLRLAREDRRTRDFTLNLLRRALAAVVASFPVYRTYIVDRPSTQDRRVIDWAIGRARRHAVAAEASVFDFLRRVLLGRPLAGAPAGLGDRYRAFARRLQQYTAPVAAKGIEDTAFYRHHRLISVNDVGGDPDSFGFSVHAFHAASRDRLRHWPHTMLATSTHDAKRSEDVRLRIDVISEMPAAWRLTVRRWRRFNRRHKRIVGGEQAPTRNDEYLLYQTLVGSFPPGPLEVGALAAYVDRIDAAMLKSARECKLATSWVNPNLAYEAALSGFVRAALEHREGNLFLDDLVVSTRLFAWFGGLNGLSAATLKALSPGVPDFYQGDETIELSLVDPDNRRPVDYARRRALLDEARALADLPDRREALHGMLASPEDGRAKFWVTWCGLQLRRAHETLLGRAEYLPLKVHGEHQARVVAFARHEGPTWLIVVAGRLFAGLGLEPGTPPVGAAWGDTTIEWPEGAPATLVDAVGGRRHVPVAQRLPLTELFADFPVALLHGA